MIQTAEIRSEKRYLKLSDTQTPLNNNHKEEPRVALHPGLSGNGLFQKVSSFHYKERIRASFRIHNEFKPDFILIKGLMEFYRPKEFIFSYDRTERSIGIDIKGDQLEQLSAFLSRIFHWTKQEKQFRHALKLTIEFENRYKLEGESLYQTLKNATIAAQQCQEK